MKKYGRKKRNVSLFTDLSYSATPGQLIGRLGVGHPHGVFGVTIN
jgi:hypothetical protein